MTDKTLLTELREEARKKFEEEFKAEWFSPTGDWTVLKFLDSLIDQTVERVVKEIKAMKYPIPLSHLNAGNVVKIAYNKALDDLLFLLPKQSITDISKQHEE